VIASPRQLNREAVYRARHAAHVSGPRAVNPPAAVIEAERRRLQAHPLEHDQSGFPIEQPPLTTAGRLRRLVTG
jgi:hypothetical protein